MINPPICPAYQLIRSGRKTLSIQISRDLKVIVRAPHRLSDRQIESFVREKNDWISRHLELQRQKNLQDPPVSKAEAERLTALAKATLPPKTAEFARRMGLFPATVTITAAKTRFGSCSSKGNLCFSYLLMRYPEAAIDYVVVHELAHLAHPNHGQAFYALIEKYLPDHKERRALLRRPPQTS